MPFCCILVGVVRVWIRPFVDKKVFSVLVSVSFAFNKSTFMSPSINISFSAKVSSLSKQFCKYVRKFLKLPLGGL